MSAFDTSFERPQLPRAEAPMRQVVPVRSLAMPTPVACISSDSLLGGGSEVLIEHHGAMYRLKQTSLGKLILTK